MLDGYGRPGSREDEGHRKIIDLIKEVKCSHDDHAAKTSSYQNRAEKKLKSLRHKLERFQIDLERANAIDERKLQAHFAELQTQPCLHNWRSSLKFSKSLTSPASSPR
ncbi:MAG: hypothetical protein ACTFAK_08200 [Candidatus Electronema sp. VV]